MNHIPLLLIPLLISASFLGCTNNDAQTEFERKAYAPADGITEIDTQRNIISEDEDDWRPSPLYNGLVDITPVYANPLPYGSTSNLDIYVKGTLLSSRIELYFLDLQNRPQFIQLIDNVSEFSDSIFIINSQEFGSNAELARGTYRLILFDGSQRIITYGDITIE